MGDALYLFSNPHPGGVMGCLSPLPEPLEDAANQIAGCRMTLVEAGTIIASAINKLGDSERYRMVLRFDNSNTSFIAIQRGDLDATLDGSGERVDCWKLIEYNLVESD